MIHRQMRPVYNSLQREEFLAFSGQHGSERPRHTEPRDLDRSGIVWECHDGSLAAIICSKNSSHRIVLGSDDPMVTRVKHRDKVPNLSRGLEASHLGQVHWAVKGGKDGSRGHVVDGGLPPRIV